MAGVDVFWHWPNLCSHLALLVIVSLSVYRSLSARSRRRCAHPVFPRIGREPGGLLGTAAARAEFMHNGRSMVEEGYTKYKDSAYIVQTADMERIILPSRYLEELRAYPSGVLSVKDAMCERHLAEWNTLDVVKRSNLHVDVTRVHLNQNLARLVPEIVDEARLAWTEELAACHETPNGYRRFTANRVVYDVVGQVVNRALVGLPVCRNREWFQITLAYASDAFSISGMLRPWPRALRHLMFPFLRSRRGLNGTLARAQAVLAPVIASRQESRGDDLDSLQWMINTAKGEDRQPTELVLKVLFLSLASTVTSAMGVTHALYDLCAFPEYIQPLREEVEQVLAQGNGWTMQAIRDMKRLDSFLRESQRINHPGLFSFNRKVMRDVELSDGSRIPRGSFVSVPTYSIARSEEHYPDAERFDAFRFYDLRMQDPSNEDRYLFTSVTPENLGFGYGAFACPGRHFAACEMKIALAVLLLNYDFKFPGAQTERPANSYMDERIWPDKTQHIEFQSRRPAT